VLLRALQYAQTFGFAVCCARKTRTSVGRRRQRRRGFAPGPVRDVVIAETVRLTPSSELMRASGARVHLCRLVVGRRHRAGAQASAEASR